MTVKSEMLPLSVVIITLNEEKRLETCLRSLPRGSEIIILDSGSTDQTAQIASKYHALFRHHDFVNYADQKNKAISLATRPWVLSLDADEVLSENLREEIAQVVTRPPGEVKGFQIKRRLVFMNRRLRFGKTTDWPMRLFLKEEASFSSAIHEKAVLKSGRVGSLRAPMDHYSYDNLEDYFKRFNSYTNLIAANHLNKGKEQFSIVAHVLRPWFEFVNRYVFRGGFLDGYQGYTYALLSSVYTFVKYAKLREMTRPELKQS